MTFKKGYMPWNKDKTGIFSEETREKMSLNHKGQIPWNKGKTGLYHTSKETKEKLALSLRGKKRPPFSREWRRNISLSLKGKIKPHKKGCRCLICNGISWNKGKKWSEKHREKLSKIKLKGKNLPSKEQLERMYIEQNLSTLKIAKEIKISQSYSYKLLKHYDIPTKPLGTYKGNEAWNKGKKGVFSKESLEKISKSLKGRHTSPKTEFPYNFPIKKPNKIEKQLDELIRKITNDFRYNGDFSQGISIGRKVPDFVNCNGKKQIIEMFGTAFHNPEKTFKKQIPYHRTYEGTIDHYKKFGFDCLIIWDYELKNPDRVVEKIKEFCERGS